MKRLHTVVMVAVMAGAGAAPSMAQPGARPEAAPATATEHRIASDPGRLELGWLRPNETGEGVVRLLNTSDEIVNILRVTTSCSCTTSELSEEQKILKPGDSTELVVGLKAGANTGPMVQRAYVWYEGSRAPYELFIVADVSHAVKTDPIFVNLLGVNRAGMIRLESLDGRPFRVLSADGKAPKVFDLAGAEVDASKPAQSVMVQYDYTGVAEEDLNRWFLIETDHPDALELPLRVMHASLYQVKESRPTWTLATDRLVLGRMQAGESVEKELMIKAVKGAEDVTEVRIDHPGLDAEIVGSRMINRDLMVKVRIKATGGATGLLKAKLIVTAESQPQEADVIVRVEGVQ